MTFNFDYSPWDKEIVVMKKEHFWRRKKETVAPAETQIPPRGDR